MAGRRDYRSSVSGGEHQIVAVPPKVLDTRCQIILDLFSARHNPAANTVQPPIVTQQEVSNAIQAHFPAAGQKRLSYGNTANFFKDLVRSEKRNVRFPQAMVALGWTARQRTGGGDSFEFVPLPAGQATAFRVVSPLAVAPVLVQSLSIEIAARKYGRRDESWLTKVVTDLGILHTHVALNNTLGVLGMAFLAPNVRFQKAEADALFYAEDGTTPPNKFLFACEMKTATGALDEDQVLNLATGVAAAPPTLAVGASVVPVAVKVAHPSSLPGGQSGVVWVRVYSTAFPPLSLVSEGLYELTPAVPGIA